MRKNDARRLDHKTLEELRVRAVRCVQAGESPEVVARLVRRSHFAVLFVAPVIASPEFTQEKSRDLATSFSGHLTATGQFVNYRDGSTRGVRVDIRGAPDGDAFSSRTQPIPTARRRSPKGATSASAPI